MPPASLTYFWAKAPKKGKFAGLIKDETWGFSQGRERHPFFVPWVDPDEMEEISHPLKGPLSRENTPLWQENSFFFLAEERTVVVPSSRVSRSLTVPVISFGLVAVCIY
ncbi:MAG: hypothetical protein U5L00_10250 [Desulfovermiculus sp.]|nr:hypothetical protein [Desulfovermiculus sp.]